MAIAPIVLFTFNRPAHTEKTLMSLMKNELADQSALFIFSDGAKENASEAETEKVKEVRKIIRSKKWCKEVHILESGKNMGLANSIIAGVTEVINQHGKVIVLEDDMITSPFFLNFMNDALNLYENEEKVACISGYVMPVSKTLPETFFIKGADCWGWATWKRAWNLFEHDGKKLLNELLENNLNKEFDFNGTFPYTQMLASQIEGKNDSWAIRWYASAFLKNKLLLYPGKSFVFNIGNDASGSHGFNFHSYDTQLSLQPLLLKKIDVKENLIAKKSLEGFYRSAYGRFSLSKKVISKVNSLFKNI